MVPCSLSGSSSQSVCRVFPVRLLSLSDVVTSCHPLIPPPRRLGARRTCWTSRLRTHLEPLLGTELEFAIQLRAGVFAVNEVAKATADTALAAIQAATCFAEVGDRTELAVDRASCIPATVKIVACALGAVLVFEARVYIAYKVVVVVVTHDQLFQLSVFAHLAPNILVEGIKVILQLRGVHAILGIERRVVVEVRHEDGLRVRRLDMFPTASISVTTCADFVVERAVDLVLLGSKDRGEEVGHVEGDRRGRDDYTSQVSLVFPSSKAGENCLKFPRFAECDRWVGDLAWLQVPIRRRENATFINAR